MSAADRQNPALDETLGRNRSVIIGERVVFLSEILSRVQLGGTLIQLEC